jgi:hypothetical protein
MKYDDMIELITEDVANVKRFNLFRQRVKKLARQNDISYDVVSAYMDDVEMMFDDDVYKDMVDDEILNEIQLFLGNLK